MEGKFSRFTFCPDDYKERDKTTGAGMYSLGKKSK